MPGARSGRELFAEGKSCAFRRPSDAKDDPNWEEFMPRLVGFSRFAALSEEPITEKVSRRILSGDQGMLVWWSIGAGVHVEPHSHPNEQIVWMLQGQNGVPPRQRTAQGDVIVIPGGTEHEGRFREATEVIDFFAPPRQTNPDHQGPGSKLVKRPAESGEICSVGRRKIAKKIAKNKRCYANTLRPRSRMLLKVMKGGLGGSLPPGSS
jgi:quercetin dioxygenase-like cupin family protein